jgi:trk system potassium uptake protein TrkA
VARKIAVIGLGDFGSQLAIELVQKGAEVLGIDCDMEKLNDLKDQITQTVCLDSSEEKSLQTQGLGEFDVVVVGIGDDFEATLLTIAALQNIGVKRIIARATTDVHERIVQHLGIKDIVQPSRESATRLANSIMVQGVLDSFMISEEHGIFEIQASEQMIGKTLGELNFKQSYELSLIAIKRKENTTGMLGLGAKVIEKVLELPSDSTLIEPGDILILVANTRSIEKLVKGLE